MSQLTSCNRPGKAQSLSLESADYGFLEWIKTSGKQRRRTTKILSVKRVRAHQFSRQIRPTGNVLIVQLSHHLEDVGAEQENLNDF
jgi:hypothetical protein